MKALLSGLAIGALLLPGGAAALEGEWFGGYSIGGQPVTITVRAYGDVGLVETQGRGADTMPSSNCSYVIELSGMTATGYPLTAGSGQTDCPQSASFTFTRNADETLGIETNVGLVDFPVNPVTRASTHGARLPFDNFDVLGVRPGQTRAEIEALLIAGRGWSEREDLAGSASTDTFSIASSVYIKSAEEIRTLIGNTLPPDFIKVSYGARATGADPADDIAIVVRRTLAFDESTAIPQQTLEESFTGKYGERFNPIGPDRAYLADGSVDTGARRKAEQYSGQDGCWNPPGEGSQGSRRENGNRPALVLYGGGGIGRPRAAEFHDFGTGCGGLAQIRVDVQNNLVGIASVELLDDAVGMAELWTQRMLTMQARLRPMIETAKAASGAKAPEL